MGLLRRLKVTQRAMKKAMLGVSLRDRMKRSAYKPRSPMLPEKLLNLKGILLAETMADGARKFLNGGREPEGTALVGSISKRWSDDLVKEAVGFGSRELVRINLGEAYIQK